MAGIDDVAKQSAAVVKMSEHWPMLHALMGGTSAMRMAGKEFLPQWPAEDDQSYNARLAVATLFPAYSRTVSVLTGKPFSKPLTYGEDVPARIKELTENIDLEGRNLDAFAADIFHEAMADGICGILVDVPTTEGAETKADGVRTVADEKAAGIRPYLVHIKHNALLGWRAERINGRMLLKQLRLMETVQEDDGQFLTKQVQQVRVLEPGKWTTYRKTVGQNGSQQWVEYKSGKISIPEIPFVPVYGIRKDFMIGSPPLLELAYLNVEHWQSKSDQQTILHVASVPVLFAKGIPEDTDLVVGGNKFVRAESENADMFYVEHSGNAIEAGRNNLLDLQERMRLIGAELLIKKPGNKTVAQTLSDSEQETCDLQRITQQVEDSLDQALDLMAKFMGLPAGGHVTIYNDFGAANLAEASANLLFDSFSTSAITHDTYLSELKRRSIISADVDNEKEIAQAKIEAAEREPVTVQQSVRN
jgi:hypothetical protein